MSQPHHDLAQIDVMVRSITALHNQANDMADEVPTADEGPELIISSRPPRIAAASEAEAKGSAEIINLIDKIEKLAAASAALPIDDDPTKNDGTEDSAAENGKSLDAVISHIHALAAEADAPTADEPTADTSQEAHVLQNEPPVKSAETVELDAAMQDIADAVRDAATGAASQAGSTQATGQATGQELSMPSQSELSAVLGTDIADIIRIEIRNILRAELADEVSPLVREALKSDEFTKAQREKIRTSRWHKS